MNLSHESSLIQETIVLTLVQELQKVPGVLAIVLGGSRASGEAGPDSDFDIGIYYKQQKPFSVEAVRDVAKSYSIGKAPTVTEFYEWGPWVNGGAWIETDAGKVDLLYKNVDQIKSTIMNALDGKWEKHFEQQPPYGFSSIIFLAETKVAIPLHDPTGIISGLKAMIETYPAKLKKVVVQESLWGAEFTIWHAEKFLRKNDMYNLVGCLTRAAKNIVDALFALNETYAMGDKRAMDILERLPFVPTDIRKRMEMILTAQNETARENVGQLRLLFNDVVALAKGLYQPVYSVH